MARVLIRQEAYESGELAQVTKEQLKQALRGVRDNPYKGKQLRGPLFGCRSIRVGGVENRLVYRYHEQQDFVEVLALERRRDDQAYDTATRRL